jgi:prevent-host-death family protein
MAIRHVGIRELKATLSECVREVRSGRSIVITEHGKPVARLVPEAISLRERVEALRDAGAAAWSGRNLGPAKPVVRVKAGRTLSDLVIEGRD